MYAEHGCMGSEKKNYILKTIASTFLNGGLSSYQPISTNRFLENLKLINMTNPVSLRSVHRKFISKVFVLSSVNQLTDLARL